MHLQPQVIVLWHNEMNLHSFTVCLRVCYVLLTVLGKQMIETVMIALGHILAALSSVIFP